MASEQNDPADNAAAGNTPVDVKPRSRDVTDGFQKAPARAMLRAIGMGDGDWDKPEVRSTSLSPGSAGISLPLS